MAVVKTRNSDLTNGFLLKRTFQMKLTVTKSDICTPADSVNNERCDENCDIFVQLQNAIRNRQI